MPQTVMPADVRFARLSPDGDAAPAGWAEAVDRDGGALVSFADADAASTDSPLSSVEDPGLGPVP